ncbi:MAG: PilZ domain-containing protein [Nitrospirota bacterium]
MEKRRSERRHVSLNASIAADGADGTGYIENICEHGLHLITASGKKSASFIPETILKLNVRNKSGKNADLHCEVRWVHINKTPVHGLTYRMGIEILKAPPEYNLFLDTLK